MKDIQEQPEKDLIPYRCGICGGENIQQAESQLWDLNKEMIIENSQYMEDFYWCPDCDGESYLKDNSDWIKGTSSTPWPGSD